MGVFDDTSKLKQERQRIVAIKEEEANKKAIEKRENEERIKNNYAERTAIIKEFYQKARDLNISFDVKQYYKITRVTESYSEYSDGWDRTVYYIGSNGLNKEIAPKHTFFKGTEIPQYAAVGFEPPLTDGYGWDSMVENMKRKLQGW